MTFTITFPDGTAVEDSRPGHSVAGLLYMIDPFQRGARVRLSRVTFEIDFHESEMRDAYKGFAL